MTTTTLQQPRSLRRSEEPEWIVWLVVILLLAAGFALKSAITGRTHNFSGSGLSLSYPAEWVETARPDHLLYASDPFSSAQFPTRVTLRQVPSAEIGRNLTSFTDVAVAWAMLQGRDKQAYRALGLEPVMVNGREAIKVEYAYVPEAVEGSHTNSLPVVARVQDYLMPQGDTVAVLSLAATTGTFEAQAGVWESILDTVQVQ